MTREDEGLDHTCSDCGGQLRRLPTLDGGGHVIVCDSCSYERSLDRSAQASDEHDSPSPTSRFRQLLDSGEQETPLSTDDLPFEGLPEEAKSLLGEGEPPQKKEKAQSPSSVTPDWEERLRRHGYYLHTDHTGPMLSGSGPKPGTGDLTPLDVVRLAADLEGGIPSPEEKMQCPHCQAVVPAGRETCQWCGGSLSDEPAASNPDG